MRSRATITAALLLLGAKFLFAADDAGTSKTLVAWVIPANLSQQGGSAMTIQSGDRYELE